MLKVVRVFFLALVVGIAGVAEADELFKATLTGAEQVPPVNTATTGRFFISLNRAQTAMEFQLFVTAGQALTQAHIHCGAVGVNGPVAAFLAGLHPGMDVDGKWVGNTIITNGSIVKDSGCGNTVATLAVSMRSGLTYVNVHNAAFPGGVIRGQITP